MEGALSHHSTKPVNSLRPQNHFRINLPQSNHLITLTLLNSFFARRSAENQLSLWESLALLFPVSLFYSALDSKWRDTFQVDKFNIFLKKKQSLQFLETSNYCVVFTYISWSLSYLDVALILYTSAHTTHLVLWNTCTVFFSCFFLHTTADMYLQ